MEYWNIGYNRMEVKKTEFDLVSPFLVCSHHSIIPNPYVFFFPNSGSIFTSAVTMNPGIVAAMTQRK